MERTSTLGKRTGSSVSLLSPIHRVPRHSEKETDPHSTVEGSDAPSPQGDHQFRLVRVTRSDSEAFFCVGEYLCVPYSARLPCESEDVLALCSHSEITVGGTRGWRIRAPSSDVTMEERPRDYQRLKEILPSSSEEWLEHVAKQLDTVCDSVNAEAVLGGFRSTAAKNNVSSLEEIPDSTWKAFELLGYRIRRPTPTAHDVPTVKPQTLQNRTLPVSPMMEIIQQCRDAFYQNKIFAPYLAVVQSSGMGKTSCLYEVAQRYTHSAYILLSTEPSKLWPSEMSQDDQSQSLDARTSFLDAVQSAALQTDSAQAVHLMQGAVKELIKACRNSAGLAQAKSERAKPVEGPVQDTMLLILDEASVLCRILCHYNAPHNRNAFELFQKVLNIIGKEDGDKIVVVVADTTSHVGNFAPTPQMLTTHARSGDSSSNLFPVVNLPMYFDALAESPNDTALSPPPQGWGKYLFRRKSFLRRFGRPLWNGAADELISKKLFHLLPEDQQEVALLGCRVSMDIVQSSLASDLVARSTAV